MSPTTQDVAARRTPSHLPVRRLVLLEQTRLDAALPRSRLRSEKSLDAEALKYGLVDRPLRIPEDSRIEERLRGCRAQRSRKLLGFARGLARDKVRGVIKHRGLVLVRPH